MNVANGNSNGVGGGPISNEDMRKPRHFRLKNRVKSPISIKIEDDSDEEPVVPPKKNGFYHPDQRMEKSVQTDNVFLIETVRRIIKERMHQYETAVLKEQGVDKQLSPLLDKLQRENDELRRQAMALRCQLEQKEKEKQSLKRRFGAIENALQSKPPEYGSANHGPINRPPDYSSPNHVPINPSSYSSPNNRPHTYTSPSNIPPNHPPNYSSPNNMQMNRPTAFTSPNNLPNRSPNSSGALGRPIAPVASGVPPRMVSARPLRPPPTLHPNGNPSAFQPIQQQRPNVHMVNPLRQGPPGPLPGQQVIRHPFAPNERFVLLNNQMIPASMNGINTQVVASNQGIRMASMPPDVSMIRSPIETHARSFANMGPNMQSNEHYKHLMQQRMPVNSINPQQMRPIQNPPPPPPPPRPPVQNGVRPYTQPHPRPPHNGQNVPNLALPFSPLPKLTANISTSNNAIVLTWNYEKSGENIEQYKVECYQLFAHQAKDALVKPPLDTKQWKKIGVVNALPLPMACTLTQFATGSVYFFAVVAVDIHGREGEMSNPCVIRLDVNQ